MLIISLVLIALIVYSLNAISDSLETTQCKYCKMKIQRNAQICAFCRMDNPANKKDIGHHIVKILIAISLFYAVFYAFSPNKNTIHTTNATQVGTESNHSMQKMSEQKDNSNQANTTNTSLELKEQKDTNELKNEPTKSNILYKGKDEHGATIYSDKPITNK